VSKTAEKEKQRIIYKPPPDGICCVAEESLDYTALCPVCEKRTIDISELPKHPIKLRYKCPHCRNIVTTPLVAVLDGESGFCVK